ncbi:McrC family protein [Thermococcus sp. 2319x1]|uniref:McrC family protein n=1 Tax=Thermococcus sp. 2319x1 TaxID=1674923 RepID=UPI001583789F|nr:hypothetical protein [Thermococcus sp. 2319x1]
MTLVDLFEFTPVRYQLGNSLKFDKSNSILYIPEGYLNKLERLNEKLNFLEFTLKTIKPKNKVGVVKVGDLTVQILPKLLRGGYEELEAKDNKRLVMNNLIEMLAIAEEVPITPAEVAELEKTDAEFLEILITLYSKKLLSLLKFERYYTYKHVEDELTTVKGQIDFARYSQKWHRRYIVPLKYNERTMDNTLNRTLKYASYLMLRMTKNRDNYRRLKAVLSIFDTVSLKPISIPEIERIQFNRLNVVFRPLVNLAKVFIEGSSVSLKSSKLETFTFLVPMERVFEKFIANTILKHRRQVLPEKLMDAKITFQHHIGYLLGGERGKYFELRPDLTIESSAGRFVVDMKYKLLKPEEKKLGVSQADLYQMYAYATKWNADGVLLVYPTLEEQIEKEWHFEIETLTGRKDIPLIIRTINLGYDLKNEWEAFLLEINKSLVKLIDTVRITVASPPEATQ